MLDIIIIIIIISSLLKSIPDVRRPLGRPKRRLEDNIKIDIKDVERKAMDWIDLDQVRDKWQDLVNEVMTLRVP